MLALTYTGSLLFALSATGEWDTEDSDTKNDKLPDVWAKSQVCSASECIEGYSTSACESIQSQ